MLQKRSTAAAVPPTVRKIKELISTVGFTVRLPQARSFLHSGATKAMVPATGNVQHFDASGDVHGACRAFVCWKGWEVEMCLLFVHTHGNGVLGMCAFLGLG